MNPFSHSRFPGDTVRVQVPWNSGPRYSHNELTTIVDRAVQNAREGSFKTGFTAGVNQAKRDAINSAKGPWVLIVREDGKLRPASTAREYTSEAQAFKVAEIMAKENPGSQFVVFQAIAQAVATAPAMTMTKLV